MKNKQKTKFLNEIKKAIKIREVESALLKLFNDGLLNGTVHTCVGQEFTGIFISKYLKTGDHIVSNHRGHGHYLSRFDDIEGLIAELMGKVSGCSGGIGGSQHIVNKNYLSNGIQGGMVPVACGISLFNKKYNNFISVAFIGDGTLGEGIIYETFNIASKNKLPLLIVLENNGIAQSTSMAQTFSGDLEKRILGFGIEYIESSTQDLYDLDNKCKEAISKVRDLKKPVFINIITNRLNSHSKGDDNRDPNNINEIRKNDYLSNVYLQKDDELIKYISDTKLEIEKTIKKVLSDSDLIDYSSNIAKKLFQSNPKINHPSIKELNTRYNLLINHAIDHFLSQNEKSIIIGEDIEDSNEFNPGEYGGAFKVTKGLSKKYPNRVNNTPISEAAITGVASGYCLAGGKAIVEIMFGDFSTLIFDQILQHCSKFELMYNGKVKCPLIIRIPMGGKRGYGPTHSQSIEKHFLGIPNLGIVALNNRVLPKFIFDNIKYLNSTPFLIIENKILYTVESNLPKIPGYSYKFNNNLFPDLIIKPFDGNTLLTIIGYGGVLIDIEKACYELLIEEEIFVEIICPTLISHIYIEEIMESVKRTSNLLVVEEGSNIASWGSEVISKLVERNISINKLSRIGNNELIPSSFKAEINVLPNVLKIKEQILTFL